MIITYAGNKYTKFDQLVGLEITLNECQDIFVIKTNHTDKLYGSYSYCVTVDNIVIIYFPHEKNELPDLPFTFQRVYGKIKVGALAEQNTCNLTKYNTIEHITYDVKLRDYMAKKLFLAGYETSFNGEDLVAKLGGKTYYWYLNNPTRMFIEYRSVEAPIDKKELSKFVTRELIHYKPQIATTINEQWLINYQVKPFSGVTLFRSHMGSGKTHVMRTVLPWVKNPIIVTPRINLTNQHHKNLGVNCVTFNSLYKEDISKIDCVIIDEFETLIEHISSFELKYDNLQKLMELCQKPNLYVFDACLSNETVKFFNFRDDIRFIANEYKKDALCVLHKTKESLMQSILENKTLRRFTVSVSTVRQMQSIADVLYKHGFQCVMLDSSVDGDARDKIISDFENGVYDVLLYTSCLGVGVSILCNSDTHYHIDDRGLLSATQSIQMTNRVREVKTIELYIPDNKVEFTPSRKYVLCKYSNTPLVDYSRCGLTELGEFFYRVYKYYLITKHKSYLDHAISVNYSECLMLQN